MSDQLSLKGAQKSFHNPISFEEQDLIQPLQKSKQKFSKFLSSVHLPEEILGSQPHLISSPSLYFEGSFLRGERAENFLGLRHLPNLDLSNLG